MGFRRPAVGCAFVLGVMTGAALPPLAATPAVPLAAADTQGPASKSVATVIKGAYAGDLLRVIDGDTFEARVHLWPGLDVTTRVRLRGIDAPEMKARCVEERNKAEAARDALASILT